LRRARDATVILGGSPAAGIVSTGPRGRLSSMSGEDADGVVPVEAVADPAGGGRVGGDLSMFVFDRRRILGELPWVDVVG
jgi:hypothetical protein